jgi:hypothetical protein
MWFRVLGENNHRRRDLRGCTEKSSEVVCPAHDIVPDLRIFPSKTVKITHFLKGMALAKGTQGG